MNDNPSLQEIYEGWEGHQTSLVNAEALVHWLEITGEMMANTLETWRILSHDIHHGGQIALMLGMQGIKAFELGDLFGHITLPPLADLV